MLAKVLSDGSVFSCSPAPIITSFVLWVVLFMLRATPLVKHCTLGKPWSLPIHFVKHSAVFSHICPIVVLFVWFVQDWVTDVRLEVLLSLFSGFLAKLSDLSNRDQRIGENSSCTVRYTSLAIFPICPIHYPIHYVQLVQFVDYVDL